MASNILGIGQSALAAAQVGISTTGHNIANASTPGYSRQIVMQSANAAQNFGYGYVGQGASVSAITRVFNELLTKQVVNTQSSYTSIETYSNALSGIDDMLSDATAGLNPAINDFFASVKNLSANASDIPTRQSMLSSANALVNRINTMGNRLNEIQSDVNTQIAGGVTSINAYASQIAKLNDVIEKAISIDGNPPNDLMDQRDLLVSELSKQIKTTVVPQGQGSYNVFVGNGMPLVVGEETFSLTTQSSPTDSSRLEVGYVSQSKVTILGKESLTGGALGGLIQFRSESLDTTQSKLGQIALALAGSFNDVHDNGVDLNGDAGGALFSFPQPTSQLKTEYADGHTVGNAVLNVTISDPQEVLASDYKLKFDGTNYTVTRLSDNSAYQLPSAPPQTVDGLTFSISTGAMAAGDEFAIRSTRNIAGSMKMLIDDPKKLAMGDTSGGASNNKNGLELAKLQIAGTVKVPAAGIFSSPNSTNKISFSTAFAQLVSAVGNKSNELKITGESEKLVLTSATAALQSESGVNLDEEATNLIRYQQAYQAAGKMMQIATELFDVLLSLG